MASFGAKNPYFCKVKEEPDGKLPVYDGEPVKIGRLVKADLSITMASGKLYADDELAESVEEFASGSLTMETDDIIDSVASVVYGTTVEEKTVHYNTKDDPPSGGLAYYKKPGQRLRQYQDRQHHLRHQLHHLYGVRRRQWRLADHGGFRHGGGGHRLGDGPVYACFRRRPARRVSHEGSKD